MIDGLIQKCNYWPGNSNAMKLWLRRTLLRLDWRLGFYRRGDVGVS